MSNKKNVKVLQLLIVILGICLIGLSIYTYNFYSNSVNTASALEKQNSVLKQDLKEMEKDYQKLIDTNTNLNQNLKKEQKRITSLLDSLEAMELSFESYRKYRVQADLLKMEKKRLLKTVDSLTEKNENLRSEINTTKSEIASQQSLADSISAANALLNDKIEKASMLQISNLEPEAVYLKANQTIKPTTKIHKAEKIRVCFTLHENPVIEAGERLLYIQIINPENNLMGTKKNKRYNKKVLHYSETTTVDYKNKQLDVCILMQAKSKNLKSGRYIVNIFDGPQRLSTTSFKLE